MSRNSLWKGAALILALVAVVGAAQAIAYSVYVDPCLAWRGEYHWNGASSAVVKVRVQNLSSCTANIVVQVQARAEDGTTASGSTYLQLFALTTREVSVNLSKRVTGLQLVQIRRIPSNSTAAQCLCHSTGG